MARASGTTNSDVERHYTVDQVMLKKYFIDRDEVRKQDRLAVVTAWKVGEVAIKILDKMFAPQP